MLADFKYSNEDPYLATIDVKNKGGFTVLCAAIKEGWTQGVCIALGAKASITMKVISKFNGCLTRCICVII